VGEEEKRLADGESTRPAASKLPAADCLSTQSSQRHRKRREERFKDGHYKKERMATPGTDGQEGRGNARRERVRNNTPLRRIEAPDKIVNQ